MATGAREKIQTTVLLTLEQAEQIEEIQRESGNPSIASVVRMLLSEALEARRVRAEAVA